MAIGGRNELDRALDNNELLRAEVLQLRHTIDNCAKIADRIYHDADLKMRGLQFEERSRMESRKETAKEIADAIRGL